MTDVKNRQADLNQANTALAKIQSQYDTALDAARQSLYALDGPGRTDPRRLDACRSAKWRWVNKGNPAHPFNEPYLITRFTKTYAGEEDALNAFQRKDVDEILESGGLSLSAHATIGNSFPLMESPGNDLSFLVFNDSNPLLGDPPFVGLWRVRWILNPCWAAWEMGSGIDVFCRAG